MSIEQQDLCETHYHEFDGMKECPLCVKEERDRLRELIPQAWDAGALWASGMGNLGIEVSNNKEIWMRQKGLV